MTRLRPLDLIGGMVGPVLLAALVAACLSAPAETMSLPGPCLTAPTGSGWSEPFPEGR